MAKKEEKSAKKEVKSAKKESIAAESINFNDLDSEIKTGMSDMIKKIVTTSIGAAFLTEEHIRGVVGKNLALPGEAITSLIDGANKSKKEITNKVTTELINIINQIDFVKEASRFVEEHKFKVSAEIEVLKKEPTSKD